MRWFVVCFFLLVLAGGCSRLAPSDAPTAALTGTKRDSAPVLSGPGYYQDVAVAAGVVFQNRNGEEANYFTMLETLGGGVGLIDFDQDGLLDLLLIGGGSFGPKQEILGLPNRLYRNEGNWKFRDVTSSAAGLDGPLFYGQGCAVGDYDNDGWPDLLVTGYGRLALYHNVQGRFQDVTEKSGLLDHRPLHWSTSAAWGDVDGDGKLDLYIAHYLDWSFQNHPTCPGLVPGQPRETCSPRMFKPLPHSLFLNNGDGTFRDASRTAGLRLDPNQGGRGLGVLALDLDGDGKLDLYVTNDSNDNFLYLNLGGGKFQEVGLARGAAVGETGKPDGSMGVDAADYDGTGNLSLFVTNYELEMHALYRNRGQGRFQHASTRTGITAIGLNYVSWGCGFLDFDRDGAEDLAWMSSHTVRHPAPPITLAQRAFLFRNLWKPGDRPADVRFENVSAKAGPFFQGLHRGHGMALGDLDNDGRIDLVVSNVNEPAAVLRNLLDNGHHWLGVELVGRPCRDAIGAKLVLESGGRRLVRAVKGGGSYCSASDRRVVFGLGKEDRPGRLTVTWPSGKVQSWEGLSPDHYWRLVEGETAPLTPQGGPGKSGKSSYR